ncbi:23S rRNA (pseudouridine(1915)-N(3))-methyltransferase RlmH [Chelatococcus reniformis]|uniref:Ribosomal RNA large subunit methyltransferase H n=1 Tax=Chelatococcus reniformis TaxID=1494448 RepID=A0A916TW66_9HYPH|nr:23S rRNA (pseudouridine(1915)-N(3))-methyltransferase RlmH [Chelatococcus reniformis]GGC45608.1 ribosomal RNA large subunit methyltransferase H [Chelatococcus reniformis]
MKIGLIAVGRLKAGPERELAQRYHERATALGRTLGLAVLPFVELAESRSPDTSGRKAEEAAAILARIDTGRAADTAVVAFDERGEAVTSEVFAGRLAAWRDGGMPGMALVIGGPDGLDPAVRQRADLTLSFGAMTLPHQIVRVLVLEQLYRAMTIMAGHPYHRP